MQRYNDNYTKTRFIKETDEKEQQKDVYKDILNITDAKIYSRLESIYIPEGDALSHILVNWGLEF